VTFVDAPALEQHAAGFNSWSYDEDSRTLTVLPAVNDATGLFGMNLVVVF
jgi:hypothetical protein